MPVTNPVPVSGSTQPPATTLKPTSTSSLTVVAVPIPTTDTETSVAQLSTTIPFVPRRWRSLDSTTGNIDNGRDVEKQRLEKFDVLRREIYYVEQELKGAETRILKLRDELYALHELDWSIQRMEDFLGKLKGRKGKEEDQGEENGEEAEGGESLQGEGERDG
ncbi:uncharacterized protein EAE97_009056 [Botrytis byssoidea]|uniref:Uncharacterized protein n=1 Tax=Botrytis byssoidea TaxID=139641 RepID=A0A9P5IAK8_9HELO|nr:uncharacterized protein EAE97_009056 [Botrytis byssoidea]KAF7932035.1 hypothetical protein EAE97_009056 [Botrytis byssoidea]